MSRITIEDVADAAGVSVATVSRALRNLPNVAPSTRDKVREVAERLGYQAHPHASRLAAGKTLSVGMVVPLLHTWYFSQVIAGAEAVLREAGYDLVLMACADDAGRRRLLADRDALPARVDGLIIAELPVHADEAARLADRGARVVTVGHRTERFCSVTIDNEQAARLATRHLVLLGHRDIGLIWASDEHSLAFRVPDDRRRGFLTAMHDAGLPIRPEHQVSGDFSIDGGSEAMSELLNSGQPPSAVFAISDEMAFGAIRMARDLGLRVPGDLSVVGFDDHEVASVLGLSTIRQSVDHHGAVAARLLLEQLEQGGAPQHVVHPTRLVVRDTTARLASDALTV